MPNENQQTYELKPLFFDGKVLDTQLGQTISIKDFSDIVLKDIYDINPKSINGKIWSINYADLNKLNGVQLFDSKGNMREFYSHFYSSNCKKAGLAFLKMPNKRQLNIGEIRISLLVEKEQGFVVHHYKKDFYSKHEKSKQCEINYYSKVYWCQGKLNKTSPDKSTFQRPFICIRQKQLLYALQHCKIIKKWERASQCFIISSFEMNYELFSASKRDLLCIFLNSYHNKCKKLDIKNFSLIGGNSQGNTLFDVSSSTHKINFFACGY